MQKVSTVYSKYVEQTFFVKYPTSVYFFPSSLLTLLRFEALNHV
jgi:hypothetical protein